MIGWSEDVDVEIEGRRRDIGAAMGVMRGIALCRPVALGRLPYDVIVGDPFGLDMRAVEKSPQPLSAFADDSAYGDASKCRRAALIKLVSWRLSAGP